MDFRSDPMESPEGKGIAKDRLELVKKAGYQTDKPTILPFLGRIVGSTMADLLGFWVIWHIYGGFEGAMSMGMSRSSVYRRIDKFRTHFGVHPDEFVLEGVDIDAMRYWSTYGKRRRR